jgi:16S rRNA (guanine(527)-N(7))-methyltransferase RsmG
MASRLPAMARDEFEAGLAGLAPKPLAAAVVDALYAHYRELARWNERLGLIGPGTVEEVLVRHYGESLAALRFVPDSVCSGVDLGSGAGFPGLVLAAARPRLEMTLVEARERKWSFLATAARRASLSCRCLNARVALPLPAGLPVRIDLITVRALKIETEVLGALARRLTPEGSVLLWAGERDPELPPDLVWQASCRLAGGERRRIVQLRPAGRALRGMPLGHRGRAATATGRSGGGPEGQGSDNGCGAEGKRSAATGERGGRPAATEAAGQAHSSSRESERR